jgi:hypothetical protein
MDYGLDLAGDEAGEKNRKRSPFVPDFSLNHELKT